MGYQRVVEEGKAFLVPAGLPFAFYRFAAISMGETAEKSWILYVPNVSTDFDSTENWEQEIVRWNRKTLVNFFCIEFFTKFVKNGSVEFDFFFKLAWILICLINFVRPVCVLFLFNIVFFFRLFSVLTNFNGSEIRSSVR